MPCCYFSEACVDFRDVEISKDKGNVKVTVDMSATEAKAFFQALHEGKLASLGIKPEGVTVLTPDEQVAQFHRVKRRSTREDLGKSNKR